MSVYDRDVNIIKQIASNQQAIDELKTKQFIGKDVYVPKIVQRYKADGVTPTDHDIEGVYADNGYGAVKYSAEGTITYTATNSNHGAWAKPFFVAWSTSAKSGLSSYGAIAPYLNVDYLVANELGVQYFFSAIDGTFYNTSVDRIYIKVYFLALDDGAINISLSEGTVVS